MVCMVTEIVYMRAEMASVHVCRLPHKVMCIVMVDSITTALSLNVSSSGVTSWLDA